MSTIIQAIQNEEISRLNTLLALVKCTESYSKYLFMAITHTKPKAAEAIFEHCKQQFSNAIDEYGNYPLKTAIYTYKNAESQKKPDAIYIIELAIKHSDDVDVKDQWQNTALMTAAYENIPQVVKLLLQANANHTITDDSGNSALDKALWEEHKDVVLEFFNHNATLRDAPTLYKGQTPLTKMIYGKKMEMVRFLIQQNVSTNATSDDGMTPQEIAEGKNLHQVLELLGDYQQDSDL